MLSINEIKNKYGLKDLSLDSQYNNQESLLLLDKCFQQLACCVNIDEKKIGCHLLSVTFSHSVSQMGFIIDDKVNINFANLSQLSKLSHEWFHFVDFYTNNLGYRGSHISNEPQFESEKFVNIFSNVLNKFNAKIQENFCTSQLVQSYLPNISKHILNEVLQGNYSNIKDFKGLNYLIADIKSIDKSFFDTSTLFDETLHHKHKYYQKNTEMLARSFECFISCNLGKNNNIAKSNFFSNIYPQKNLQQEVSSLWNNIIAQFNTLLIIQPNINNNIVNLRQECVKKTTQFSLKN